MFLEDAAGQKVQVEKADIKAGDAVVHVIGVSACLLTSACQQALARA